MAKEWKKGDPCWVLFATEKAGPPQLGTVHAIGKVAGRTLVHIELPLKRLTTRYPDSLYETEREAKLRVAHLAVEQGKHLVEQIRLQSVDAQAFLTKAEKELAALEKEETPREGRIELDYTVFALGPRTPAKRLRKIFKDQKALDTFLTKKDGDIQVHGYSNPDK